MSLHIQDISYVHPNRDVLFQHISLSMEKGNKSAIVGNNGTGKSTLLHILARRVHPSSGEVTGNGTPYLVPQHMGQFDHQSIAEAIGVADRLNALHAILNGDANEQHFETLNDDWTLEERIGEALYLWGLDAYRPDTPMGRLSGGEKTKAFLAGITVCQPETILMDEPTNHLDTDSRKQLYDFIDHTSATLLVVSHDRELLNRLPALYELSADGMKYYPMNYDAYREYRQLEQEARTAQLENQQKELAKAKLQARKATERQEKHNTRGEKQSRKKCVARIMLGNLQNQAQGSTARLQKTQQRKIQDMTEQVQATRSTLTDNSRMAVDFDASDLHTGKRLIEAQGITFTYPESSPLWESPLDFTITSGDRLRLEGSNGSGKSTLLKLITGEQMPTGGKLHRAEGMRCVYLDQEYSFINNQMTVFEQLAQCNPTLREHEVKMYLHRFLFTASSWDKKCAALSGGEKMKLTLCCLMVSHQSPDLIIADEPTNNLDLSSIEVLTETLRKYQGTLIIVSHDTRFCQELGLKRSIHL